MRRTARRDPPEQADGHYRDALALAEELKSRRADERDEEIQRLCAKVGAITMAKLLGERSRAAEARLPLARRRRNR